MMVVRAILPGVMVLIKALLGITGFIGRASWRVRFQVQALLSLGVGLLG